MQWLDNDKNATQSIHAFAAHKYQLKSEEKYGENNQVTPEREKSLRRAYKKLRSMQELQQDQAKLEGRTPHPLPDRNYDRPLTFSDLRFIDLYSDKFLYWYELLVQRKQLLYVGSRKKANEALKAACELHNKIIDEAKNISCTREYVAACIHLCKYEQAFRFSLFAKIAWYLKSHMLPMNTPLPSAFYYYWGRYLTQSIFPSSDSLLIQYYDFLDYDQTIQRLFDPKTPSSYPERVSLWRELLVEVLQLMDNIENPCNMPAWTDKDFMDAFNFFKKDYPIIEEYSPIKLDNDCVSKNSYYDYIRAIYTPLDASSNPPLSNLRSQKLNVH